MLNAALIVIIARSAIWPYLDAIKRMSRKTRDTTCRFVGMSITALVISASTAACSPTENSAGRLNDGPGKGDEKTSLEKAASEVSSSGWSLGKTSSGIDGDVLVASRTYPFNQSTASFKVQVTCKAAARTLEMKIQSFVGDAAKPSEQSAFVSQYLGSDLSPSGRVKTGDGTVVENMFRTGEYSNEAKWVGSLAHTFLKIDGRNSDATIWDGRLATAFPMVVELSNGAGTFELSIDRSVEVERVLAECGQDQATLARAEAEQARITQEAKEKSTRSAVISQINQSCKDFGDLSGAADVETALAALPLEMRSDIQLDCAAQAPEALAEFNRMFEENYARRVSRAGWASEEAWRSSYPNGRCSKEELRAYARANNLPVWQIPSVSSREGDDCERVWKPAQSDNNGR